MVPAKIAKMHQFRSRGRDFGSPNIYMEWSGGPNWLVLCTGLVSCDIWKW